MLGLGVVTGGVVVVVVNALQVAETGPKDIGVVEPIGIAAIEALSVKEP
jgi:hypothetical protein